MAVVGRRAIVLLTRAGGLGVDLLSMSESALGETGSARKILVSSRDSWYVLVFLHKKDGRDSSSSTSFVRSGGKERTSSSERCHGHCGHNHDSATAANDALADGKAGIALLAREILCNPYFAFRANSKLL